MITEILYLFQIFQYKLGVGKVARESKKEQAEFNRFLDEIDY